MKIVLACLAVFGELMVLVLLSGLSRESTGRHIAPPLLVLAFFLIAGWTWRSITKKKGDRK